MTNHPHSLEVDEFSDDDYNLIAIHTTIEDYLLAFLLNKNLKTRFIRSNEDLDFKYGDNFSVYSIYEYINDKEGFQWFLIANTYKKNLESFGIFNETEIQTLLIPEQKTVDYFLKLEGNVTPQEVKNFIQKINAIPQIITSHEIEVSTIKSRQNLII